MKISLFESKNLLTILAVGQGASLTYASVVLDGHTDLLSPLFWLAVIRGLVLGFGAAFAASYAAYELPRCRKPLAQKIGWYALGAQVFFTFVMVMFCGVGAPVDWQRWIVSGAYSLVIEASVIAVAMSSGRMFVEAPVSEGKPTEAPVKRAKSTVEPGHWPVVRRCPHCEAAKAPVIFETDNKAQYSGHVGKCQHNPARQFARLTKEKAESAK